MFITYDISVEVIMGQRLYVKGYLKKEDSTKISYGTVCFPVDNISDVNKALFKKGDAVLICGVTDNDENCIVYLPEFDIDEINRVIDDEKETKRKREAEEEERKNLFEEKKRQEELAKIEDERIHAEYVKTQYLDVKEKEPVYVFEETDGFVTFLHIDRDKNMIIKSIDKNQMETVSSTIQYKDIHYYEKAGTIHYVSNIDISDIGQSFAGSFVPGKVRLTPAVVGGLLFGPMGLAVGAMAGYKPAHFENTQQNFYRRNVSSNIHKIDDRSVLLNYFSDKHKQYMDVELPQEIYNFLQTHLAEKKYDIVLSVEKQKYGGAVLQQEEKLLLSESTSPAIEKKKLSIEEFEMAVKKLKLMLDNELISEEEFKEKKKELFENI